MTRASRATEMIVGAPEKAPVIAYPVSVLLFGLFAYRVIAGIASGKEETLTHAAIDGLFFVGGCIAWPKMMRYMASGAGVAIDLYRKIRRAREPKEDRASRTMPPRRGGDGPT